MIFFMEKPISKKKLYICFAIIVLLFAVLFSISCGAKYLSPAEILRLITGRGEAVITGIFKYSRLPRTIACVFAGAALASSGAVLQNVLSNKLASPGIIGVNSGAGLGVTVCCALGILSGWIISAAAFAGAIVTVLIITLFSYRIGASKTTVILGGVALNSILSACSEAIVVLNPTVGILTAEFRIGGFSAVTYGRLIPAVIMITFAIIALFTLTSELDILSLGDETSVSLGLNVKKYRIIFLILAALLAGAAVSFSGLLGFVGLIVPHFTRKLSDNESKYFIPLSAVSGAAFVTLCDTAARIIFLPYELPVGIIMSVIGGPLFVLILIHSKGGHRHA